MIAVNGSSQSSYFILCENKFMTFKYCPSIFAIFKIASHVIFNGRKY